MRWSRWRAALLILLSLPACTSWRAENVAPADLAQRGEVRVLRRDGSQFTLWQPRIDADTLHGYRKERSGLRGVSIPLSEIAHVQTRHTDAWKTGFLVFGIGAAVVATIVVVAAASFPND